jgi:perosamine synthetase|tara:strand:+ start:888 stop:2063 length:1176 start_codon:yes stop_codon:yes gene_type:complete
MKLSTPHIDNKDYNYLKKVMKSSWISTSSSYVNRFEKKISKISGTKYAVATNSGTSAIHLALMAMGVNENCEVIVPSITFIATANPILYLKAKPIIIDVDEKYNLKIEDVLKFIKEKTIFRDNVTINKKTKKILKVIIVAHMWGRPCDFLKIKKVCKKRNIYILEDAAEALGSYIKSQNSKKYYHCGSIGDVGCLSFNANKIITTGSGGALITNNKNIFKKSEYLASQAKDDSFNYIHNECGYNYKMNGLNASLGLTQISKLSNKITKRKNVYKRYNYNFKSHSKIRILDLTDVSKINYWINVVYFEKLGYQNVEKLSIFLKKKNIETRRVWRPLNLQRHLRNFETFNIKNSERLYNNSLCLPSNDTLSKKDIDKVCNCIKNFYENITSHK